MHEFSVWAPKPDIVRLDVDGTAHPMARDTDGWWRATVDILPNARYGYLLDDDPTLVPDPRSPRQPEGVHARSQVWEPTPQDWTDGDWAGRSVQGAVIYELHIGTFTPAGTFDAAIDKLDYLVGLGVDFVEVMPVNAFSGTHGWGYDGVLWYAVHEPYGGPDGLVRFVDACHRRGLGVLIDAVFNHLGPSGNYLPRFGPYLSSASNPWGEGINIADAGSDEVRRYIIDCALRWMRDFRADGLRLDAVHALFDTTAIHILEELSAETDTLAEQLGRPLSLVAESDLNDPRMITARRGPRSTGWPRSGTTTSTTPSTPRCPASARATTPTSGRWPPWQRRCATASSTRPPTRRFGSGATAGRWTPRQFRPPGWWPTPAPTTRSATAHSGTGRRRT
jgi:maltooligosyltrehalose trehalohydrolase